MGLHLVTFRHGIAENWQCITSHRICQNVPSHIILLWFIVIHFPSKLIQSVLASNFKDILVVSHNRTWRTSAAIFRWTHNSTLHSLKKQLEKPDLLSRLPVLHFKLLQHTRQQLLGKTWQLWKSYDRSTWFRESWPPLMRRIEKIDGIKEIQGHSVHPYLLNLWGPAWWWLSW